MRPPAIKITKNSVSQDDEGIEYFKSFSSPGGDGLLSPKDLHHVSKDHKSKSSNPSPYNTVTGTSISQLGKLTAHSSTNRVLDNRETSPFGKSLLKIETPYNTWNSGSIFNFNKFSASQKRIVENYDGEILGSGVFISGFDDSFPVYMTHFRFR